MPTTRTATTEGAIWNRLFRPDRGDLPREVAHFFLNLAFDPRDLDRMHQLAVKNQEGLLTPAEQQELKSYRQVGLQVDLLRAKARLSLKRQAGGR